MTDRSNVLQFTRVRVRQPDPPRVTARQVALASLKFWTAYWLVPVLWWADLLDSIDTDEVDD